ncbi:MAG: N-formylglutamate amidohydrolase [Desulfosarcina sp.]|nr:N-formylglutamate amidohydrolase [Desulfosarcina sp.]MBC2741797.1 N-formylglutamate amidohydrolase [Desulfosarcina sp.]MBC2764711.1 N-formylglutamate amidohydrolase [Desulfosarcina sp.]
MSEPVWKVVKGNGPIVATAIHSGHDVRPDVRKLFAISKDDRLREEDPYTGDWAVIAPTHIIGLRSRFEVDLNRPRDKSVYIQPEDAWGLKIWKHQPTDKLIKTSLEEYDEFYSELRHILSEIESRYGRFVVFDLHSYNHRRKGPESQPEDAKRNPEVNLGTGTMNRELWAAVVARFMNDLRKFDFGGRRLDVRENVKFRGGQLSRWVDENYPETGCSLSIEFKKFFMDEWTGQLYPEEHQRIKDALKSTVIGVLEEL